MSLARVSAKLAQLEALELERDADEQLSARARQLLAAQERTGSSEAACAALAESLPPGAVGRLAWRAVRRYRGQLAFDPADEELYPWLQALLGRLTRPERQR